MAGRKIFKPAVTSHVTASTTAHDAMARVTRNARTKASMLRQTNPLPQAVASLLGAPSGRPTSPVDAIVRPARAVCTLRKAKSRLRMPVAPPSHPSDANALQDAIGSMDRNRLKRALSALQLLRLPLTIRDGTPALIHALEANASDEIINIMLLWGCPANVLDKNGYTPLIIACIKGRDEAVRMLLSEPSTGDINYEAPDGARALGEATSRGDAGICDMLIQAGADVRVVLRNGRTPLRMAYTQRHTEIEKMLIKANAAYFPIPERFRSIRDYRRAAKSAIVAAGPVAPLPHHAGPFAAPDIVASQMYCVDSRDKELLKDAMHILYTCPALHPLIDMAALIACGKDSIGLAAEAAGRAKQLKIFCLPDLVMLYPLSNEEYGLYTRKSSVFVHTDRTEGYRMVVGTIIHEVTHLVMMRVFNNDSKPYAGDCLAASERADVVLRATQERIGRGSIVATDDDEAAASACIQRPFEMYDGSEHMSELIVRCPQIIAILGPERGVAWLRANTPELWHYFADEVNPTLAAYLASHHAMGFILPPDHAALAARRALLPSEMQEKQRRFRHKIDENIDAFHLANARYDACEALNDELGEAGLHADPRGVAAQLAYQDAVRCAHANVGMRWPEPFVHLNP